MYCSSKFESPAAGPLQDSVEPLLIKYKVDLAIWGHHHSYQRTKKVKGGAPSEDGVVHLVIGMAGYELSSVATEKPDTHAVQDDQHYGFTKITTTQNEMTVEYIIAGGGYPDVPTEPGTVFDKVVITHK